MHTKELGTADTLHRSTVDGQRGMLSVWFPEVHYNLLRLFHVQREIIITVPCGQVAHLTPVVCLISVDNETDHGRVIHKGRG